MRKQTSTNFLNEQSILETCSMALTISLLSGRWKPTIVWKLQQEPLTYTELKNSIPGATERMLVKQLQELEKDGLILKISTPDVPGKNKYALSETGCSIIPILQQIERWGDAYKAGMISSKS